MRGRFLPYHVMPRGHGFAVYRWDDRELASATKIAQYATRDEALAEAYRMNGEYFARM